MLKMIFTEAFIVGLIISTIRLATPLLYAALGEMFSQRAGVTNIGLEGIMTVGTLAGFFGVFITGNMWMGVLAGILGGILANMVFAFGAITLNGDQTVNGMVINILAAGVCTYIYRTFFGLKGEPTQINGFSDFNIPILSDIPIIGKIFFSHNILVYLVFILVPVAWIILYKTTFGLKLRSVGEHPKAADSLGINVNGTRYLALAISGGMAGLGGAYLSIAYMNKYLDNMVAGRGFIVLAAVIFGKWKPQGILGAVLLFGFADALQLRLQALGFQIPYQFLVMLPYVLTLVALVGVIGKTVAPAANGQPFKRGTR